jgi:hypothetical protein
MGAVLERVALRQADLASGYTIKLMQDGDQVVGQVTLDNCGYDFTTEAHRVARRQYVVYAGASQAGISNELVAYDSPAQASLALAQWHAAAARCPSGPVRSTVAGVPLLTMKVTRNDLGSSSLPLKQNAVTVESAEAQGQTSYMVGIVQISGRYLDNVYEETDTATTPVELAAAIQLATITGKRLASAG